MIKVFLVCLGITVVLLVAAIILNWRHDREVIRLTEMEAAGQRAREAGHENEGEHP
jgi:hypothetical protein